MLGLHENGAKAGERLAIAAHGSQILFPEMGGEFGDGEMEIVFCGGIEEATGKNGGFADARGARSKDEDVQLRRESGKEAVVGLQFFEELEGSSSSALQATSEFAGFF